MIEGKLLEQGREPRNIQVVLGAAPGSVFHLRDLEGTILEVEEETPEQRGPEGPDGPEAEPGVSGGPGVELESLRAELEAARAEKLRQQLEQGKLRLREVWRTNCRCLAEYDELLSQQEAEISRLKGLRSPRSHSPDIPSGGETAHDGEGERAAMTAHRPRRGKAPPVDPFTGENPEIRLEEWLPSLQRASTWNGWTEEELLLQLAGHLRGRVLQEWGLLDASGKETYSAAVESLRGRLDPGSRTLAAQDYRHTRQGGQERMSTFIRRLERTFQIAYGHDSMSAETRDTLLHGQLQEGLLHEIMRAPAVTGAQTYKELCLAACNEEKRLAELRKRREYQQPAKDNSKSQRDKRDGGKDFKPTSAPTQVTNFRSEPRKCFMCHKAGHMARDCAKRTESKGQRNDHTGSKQITAGQSVTDEADMSDALRLLYSSDEEEDGDVDVVRAPDKASRPRCAPVDIQGVPAYGVIDSGSDITIIGGELLRKVAAVTKLRKKDLKPPDRAPRNYDQRPFKLHGMINLSISFAGQVLTTTVYVKMDTVEPLLLSEGVCRQLGIIQYHPQVQVCSLKERQRVASTTAVGGTPEVPAKELTHILPESTDVPASVRMTESLRLPPGRCAVVPVAVEGDSREALKLVEPDPSLHDELGLELSEGLIQVQGSGQTQLTVINRSGFTQQVGSGTRLAYAVDAEVIDGRQEVEEPASGPGGVTVNPVADLEHSGVRRVNVAEEGRKRKLLEMVEISRSEDPDQAERLRTFLAEHHEAFSIEPGERGETEWVQMDIDTGNAAPC